MVKSVAISAFENDTFTIPLRDLDLAASLAVPLNYYQNKVSIDIYTQTQRAYLGRYGRKALFQA